MEMITTWLDRPIRELSREELIEALEFTVEEEARMRRDHERTLNMWSLCREARTG